MHYQIINLETGDFQVVTLDQAAEIAALDPADIEWAIEEHGVCETEIHQITQLPEPPEGDIVGAAAVPFFTLLSASEFEARLARIAEGARVG